MSMVGYSRADRPVLDVRGRGRRQLV